jgi:hypothetical protein
MDSITLEFEPFKYSDKGNFVEGTSLTVRAPGFDKRKVHNRMGRREPDQHGQNPGQRRFRPRHEGR